MILKALSLSYAIQEKKFIDDISLEFQPGILYGILGPNGSGKSTLLKVLSGIWTPTSGQVLWNGQELLKKPRKEISRIISLVPQNPHIQLDFPVYDCVTMGRYPHQDSGSHAEAIEWALKVVDAWHLQERLVTQLSSGERQRVYIARALATESAVLLLDEPTASLDICHQLEIWHLLKKLSSQGKIVVVTIHDLPSTARFCDEIAVLDQGRNVGRGGFSQVMRPQLLKDVFGVVEQVHPLNLSFDLP